MLVKPEVVDVGVVANVDGRTVLPEGGLEDVLGVDAEALDVGVVDVGVLLEATEGVADQDGLPDPRRPGHEHVGRLVTVDGGVEGTAELLDRTFPVLELPWEVLVLEDAGVSYHTTEC